MIICLGNQAEIKRLLKESILIKRQVHWYQKNRPRHKNYLIVSQAGDIAWMHVKEYKERSGEIDKVLL